MEAKQKSGSLTFCALSAGSASITLYLKDSEGKTVAERQISVQVKKDNMTISTNRSSVALDLKDKPSDTIQLSWNGQISAGTKLYMEYSNREMVREINWAKNFWRIGYNRQFSRIFIERLLLR